LLLGLVFVSGCSCNISPEDVSKYVPEDVMKNLSKQLEMDDETLAIAKAIKAYQQQKELDLDFTNGPCLDDKLMEDWVADVAHNPRQTVDDRPENQCPSYGAGQAHHFVELDPAGNLIRAK